MRFVTYARSSDGTPVLASADKAGNIILPKGTDWPSDIISLIRRGSLKDLPTYEEGSGTSTDRFKLMAPVPRPPKNVLCIGRNYLEHVQEGARARNTEDKPPEVPVFFTKAHTCIIGHDEEIVFNPKVSTQIDWEAELGVIIGKKGRDISEENALDYVFGYTCINDVTARDLQRKHNQWFKGKSLDTFCPMGPWIVTADEIGDPQNLRIQCRVNGETKQDANTRDMIFNVRQIIAALSAGFTLEPGDVIATGTPSGVGFARNPPEFLKDGDVVEVEVEKIGVLRNKVKSL